ncbi:hypothetical protein DPMN_055771 [Dreissena polymorpha]|uniref:Uncharacterized protein n=1 Tax=Dreissena polymorpha TaxID=45954 RepID=A0A9D4HUE2_DREPO|nr:hypothetical protein DPMN_055771 [Dreissena polymorpha]
MTKRAKNGPQSLTVCLADQNIDDRIHREDKSRQEVDRTGNSGINSHRKLLNQHKRLKQKLCFTKYGINIQLDDNSVFTCS